MAQQETARGSLRLIGYMLGTAIFFVVTLLVSFFIVISLINQMNIPGDIAPNFFMLGLIPPSLLTVILFTKVLGRFAIGKID